MSVDAALSLAEEGVETWFSGSNFTGGSSNFSSAVDNSSIEEDFDNFKDLDDNPFFHSDFDDGFDNDGGGGGRGNGGCKKILYLTISSGSDVRVWDVIILIPNLIFLTFLLARFNQARQRLMATNRQESCVHEYTQTHFLKYLLFISALSSEPFTPLS